MAIDRGPLLILGGCGGIGRALVEAAGRAGYRPIVLDLPASIEAHPPAVEALAVDASRADSLAAAAAALPDGLAGLVNLCGFMTGNAPVTTISETEWDAVIDGNLKSAFLAAKTLAPKLAEGGAMVLTGSGLGHFVRPGYGPYAISKAGIAALTRQLALEMAPRLRVNCVAPSAVDTAFLRGGTGRSDEREPTALDIEAYARAIPMQRIALPADVVGPMLFLLSDAAAYMTGQVLHVNGGAYMP